MYFQGNIENNWVKLKKNIWNLKERVNFITTYHSFNLLFSVITYNLLTTGSKL